MGIRQPSPSFSSSRLHPSSPHSLTFKTRLRKEKRERTEEEERSLKSLEMSKLHLLPSHFNALKNPRTLSPFPWKSPFPKQLQSCPSLSNTIRTRTLCSTAKEKENTKKTKKDPSTKPPWPVEENENSRPKVEYPSGEFEFKEITGWKNFVVKLRMLFALPWERVRKGSVLSMKLRGQVRNLHTLFVVLCNLIHTMVNIRHCCCAL